MVMENSKVWSFDVTCDMDYGIQVLMVKPGLKPEYKSTQCTALYQSTQPRVKMAECEQNIGILQTSFLV